MFCLYSRLGLRYGDTHATVFPGAGGMIEMQAESLPLQGSRASDMKFSIGSRYVKNGRLCGDARLGSRGGSSSLDSEYF